MAGSCVFVIVVDDKDKCRKNINKVIKTCKDVWQSLSSLIGSMQATAGIAGGQNPLRARKGARKGVRPEKVSGTFSLDGAVRTW
jgi:hypothetical protein